MQKKEVERQRKRRASFVKDLEVENWRIGELDEMLLRGAKGLGEF